MSGERSSSTSSTAPTSSAPRSRSTTVAMGFPSICVWTMATRLARCSNSMSISMAKRLSGQPHQGDRDSRSGWHRRRRALVAPYNPHRVVHPDPFWPFGRCECCGKPTMYDCTVCGLCATEPNTKETHTAPRRPSPRPRSLSPACEDGSAQDADAEEPALHRQDAVHPPLPPGWSLVDPALTTWIANGKIASKQTILIAAPTAQPASTSAPDRWSRPHAALLTQFNSETDSQTPSSQSASAVAPTPRTFVPSGVPA